MEIMLVTVRKGTQRQLFGWLMDRKGFGRKHSRLKRISNLGTLSTKMLSDDSLQHGWYSKQGLLEYKSINCC
jgi:hypothetical protein